MPMSASKNLESWFVRLLKLAVFLFIAIRLTIKTSHLDIDNSSLKLFCYVLYKFYNRTIQFSGAYPVHRRECPYLTM